MTKEIFAVNFTRHVGQYAVGVISAIGRVSIFITHILLGLVSRPFYWKNILSYLVTIGFYSIPIISLTCFFSGAVLALQTYTGFARLATESSVAYVVSISMVREVAPVMSSLIIAGKVGSANSAEIATMKVSEQLDALFTLSINPLRYIIVPNLIASIIALPILVIIGDVIGILGGYMVGIYELNFNHANYLLNTTQYLTDEDIYSGLIKAVVFGIVISITSCYTGYSSNRGAKGVGISTNQSVFTSSIFILVSNYLITQIMF